MFEIIAYLGLFAKKITPAGEFGCYEAPGGVSEVGVFRLRVRFRFFFTGALGSISAA